MSEELVIRNVREEEHELLTEWFTRENWNPGLSDIQVASASKKGHFYLGLLGSKPVCCLSAHVYEAHFAFLGYHFVEPLPLRGQGYGLKIWQRVMEDMHRIGVSRLGLDAVPDMADVYRMNGFRDAHQVQRYSYRVRNMDDDYERFQTIPPSGPELTKFDSSYTAEPRSQFMHKWLDLDVSRRHLYLRNPHGFLKGYGSIREAAEGYRIGPLYARTPRDAADLILGLTGHLYEGTQVFIDIPEANSQSKRLINLINLKPAGFSRLRMYKGRPAKVEIDEIFGIGSVEMG